MSIVETTPFGRAIVTLARDWPARFTLEVPASVFRDIQGGLREAMAIRAAMEGMKLEADDMGYDVHTQNHRDPSRAFEEFWVYLFIRRANAVRPVEPKPVMALPPGPDELDKFLAENPT